MKKTLLLTLGIAAITMVACKKDSTDTPTPESTVVLKQNLDFNTYKQQPNPDNSQTWFSASDGKLYTMTEINNDPSLQSKIDFGYTVNIILDGVFSPSVYPDDKNSMDNSPTKAWTKKNNTTFKTLTNLDDVELAIKNDAVTKEVIANAYSVGANPANSLVGFGVEKSFTFKTESGVIGIVMSCSKSGDSKVLSAKKIYILK